MSLKMTVKFVGLINRDNASETQPAAPDAPVIDFDHMIAAAQSHEAAGFDRVLIAHNARSPDGLLMATRLAEHTTRLKFMIAHRPGFIAPTWAARSFATFDYMFPGRVGIHVISGGSDVDQRADGDFLSHDQRYARTAEWLEIFHKEWTSEAPFDHEGEFYRFERAHSSIRPSPKPPIFFAGASDAAIAAGAKHADIWALFGEPVEETRRMIARIRAAAMVHGRSPDAIRFMMSFRPVVGDTEAEAWAKAAGIIERVRGLAAGKPLGGFGNKPQSHAAQRLRDLKGQVQDERLWTELALLTGGGSSTTGLVGTPEQIAESAAEYVKIGIEAFLIRGFQPEQDAHDFGRTLIPAIRDYLARHAVRAA
jgi:alkanesulfonate monooxygenase